MAFGEVGKKPPENFLSKDPTSPRPTSPLPIGGRTAARLRRRFPPLLPQPRRDMSARFGEVGEVEKVGLKFGLLCVFCMHFVRTKNASTPQNHGVSLAFCLDHAVF